MANYYTLLFVFVSYVVGVVGFREAANIICQRKKVSSLGANPENLERGGGTRNSSILDINFFFPIRNSIKIIQNFKGKVAAAAHSQIRPSPGVSDFDADYDQDVSNRPKKVSFQSVLLVCAAATI